MLLPLIACVACYLFGALGLGFSPYQGDSHHGRGGRIAAAAIAAIGVAVHLVGLTQERRMDPSAALSLGDVALVALVIAVTAITMALRPRLRGMAALLLGNCRGTDGLVHAAAALGERAPIEHYDVVKWLKVMHVNVNAAIIVTQALLPLLRLSQDASVVFTTSGVSVQGRAYWGAYAASKFAVEGLMQVLADETDRVTNIRSNSVNPGRMRTPMRAAAYPGEVPDELPAPDQVLGPFLYLLGPESRGVTGRRFDAQ